MIFQIENLTKSYSLKPLFKGIQGSWTDQDRIGLIGVNGTGKSTLLKVLARISEPDVGQLIYPRNASLVYLAQEPDFNPSHSVLEAIFEGENHLLKCIKAYEAAQIELTKEPHHPENIEAVSRLTEEMTSLDAWSYEREIKSILFQLGIGDLTEKISNLSGGMIKRVALAKALVLPSDLLMLDEPTNHLDASAIEWLEGHLKQRPGGLVLITHDRYFLDRVVNRIFELDQGKLYAYPGNYSAYLTGKSERLALEAQEHAKLTKLYQQELAWMRQGVEARRTKQEARKQRFYQLQSNMTQEKSDERMAIDISANRLGKTVVDLFDIVGGYSEAKPLFKAFSYAMLRDDRIGVVGLNGVGKSTFINTLVGALPPLSGSVRIGKTVEIGYFKQEMSHLPEGVRVIDYIKEIAELSKTKTGYVLTASQMLERFLFDSQMQYSLIKTLSGGERRRLYLLGVLMGQPNILVLDEPTNDLDLTTLGVLEDYLDEFPGAVIVVSHDRYFLDRTCEKIFLIEKQSIHELQGNYSENSMRIQASFGTSQIKATQVNYTENQPIKTQKTTQKKVKLSYNEQRELDAIGPLMETLEVELEAVLASMESAYDNYLLLQDLNTKKEVLENRILEALERQEILEAKQNSI